MGKLALSLLVALLSSSLILNVSSLDCSLLVEEVQSGLLNWLGDVTFVVPVSTDETGWLIVMNFDQVFTGVGVWEVFAESNGTAKWTQITPRDDNFQLNSGDEFYFRFRINYGLDIPKPQLVGLNFQGIELCK